MMLQSTDIYQPRHSAPSYRTEDRRTTDWSKLDNNSLKFALDLLELHYSPFTWEVYQEIDNRIQAGNWLNLDNPPPPLEDIPKWLKTWPFRLLWRQRPRWGSGCIDEK